MYAILTQETNLIEMDFDVSAQKARFLLGLLGCSIAIYAQRYPDFFLCVSVVVYSLLKKKLIINRGATYTIEYRWLGIRLRREMSDLKQTKSLFLKSFKPKRFGLFISTGGRSGTMMRRPKEYYGLILEFEDGTQKRLWESGDKAAVAEMVQRLRPYLLGKAR